MSPEVDPKRPTAANVRDILAELADVFQAARARPYIGEAIDQLEHGLQAAAAAERAGADAEVVLAAWLHDIGHLIAPDAPTMAELGVLNHEGLGADWLRVRGFSERVARLVAAHVAAKRYLVARRAAYAERLSDASRGTLAFQGGPMSEEEASVFEAREDLAEVLRVRAWDEAAKVVGAETPGLDHYLALAEAHLRRS